MPLGMIITPFKHEERHRHYALVMHLFRFEGRVCSYRRGVLVARSDELGYPRASVVERVTGKILHAFFVYRQYVFYKGRD